MDAPSVDPRRGRVCDSIVDAIGDTPIVALRKLPRMHSVHATIVPESLDRSVIDEVVRINSATAIEASRALARSEGIPGGILGSRYCGGLQNRQAAEEQGQNHSGDRAVVLGTLPFHRIVRRGLRDE